MSAKLDDTIGFAIDAMAKDLGMEYIHTYNRFDASVQKDNVETILAKNPNVIAAVSVDPTISTSAFKKAADRALHWLLCQRESTPEVGIRVQGGARFLRPYRIRADAGEGAQQQRHGGKRRGGIVFHQANFFITNQRDQGFKDALKAYPGLKIVDERPTGNTMNDTEGIVAAIITKHPEIKGIYLPWQEHVMPAISALRAAGRTDIKIVTGDIGKTTALEMITGKNLVMMTQCAAWQYGITVTEMGCYAILGKKIPAECIIVPGLGATWKTIDKVWPRGVPPRTRLGSAGCLGQEKGQRRIAERPRRA